MPHFFFLIIDLYFLIPAVIAQVFNPIVEPKVNGIYSRNNLSKINEGAYITNLDEYESIGAHWIAL